MRVTAQVENVGERDGTLTANLTVDAQTVDSTSVTLEPGASETVAFELGFDEPGEYEIAVAGTSVGSLIVTVAPDYETPTTRPREDGPGSIEVLDATIPADWVRRGHETAVRATVVNTGDRLANRTLTVTVDGRSVGLETVTLQPYEADVVEIRAAIGFDVAGGTVAVEGVEAGKVTVSERYGEEWTEPTDAAEESGVGLGLATPALVVIITALAGLAVVSGRRR